MPDTQSGPGKFKIPSGEDDKLLRSAMKGDELVENIKSRWKAHLPYTAIGQHQLVVVNPFNNNQRRSQKDKEVKKAEKSGKSVGEYSEDVFEFLLEDEKKLLLTDYQSNIAVQEGSQAHVFTLAARVFCHMMREKQNQVVVFQGDSGSGKSHQSRLVIRQLVQFNPSKLSLRYMAASQLLDMFSTARTHFNPDSSRVHYYKEMQFSKNGKLLGGKFVALLLEKSRIVQQFGFSQNESNFHVFYQLFSSELKGDRERFQLLDSTKSYRYLQPKKSKLPAVEISESQSRMVNIKQLMRAAGFSVRTQDEIFKLLSCILLLGNINFDIVPSHKQDGAFVKNVEVLESCSVLLGVNPESLATTITQRTTRIGTTLCADFLSIEQSSATRDKLAITLYMLLFEYLVKTFNNRLNLEDNKKIKWESCIGLLDFAGFEDYGQVTGEHKGTGNRFWQFATNYADQCLQQWTKERMFGFDSEAKEATEPSAVHQGLKLSEQQVMQQLQGTSLLYSQPSNGLLQVLDQETLRIVDGSEVVEVAELFNRANKVHTKRMGVFKTVPQQTESGNRYFVQGHSKHSFGIKHYGGYCTSSHSSDAVENCCKVYYDTSDFIIFNSQGGQSKIVLNNDHLRLIKGTADFPACKNKLLLKLAESLETEVQVEEQKGSLKRTNTIKPVLDRIPSMRIPVNNDAVRLSTIVQEELGTPDTDLQDLDNIPVMTEVSDFSIGISKINTVLSKETAGKWWFVWCIKPNDQYSSKKFNDERVKLQVRRLDIPLIAAKGVGTFSHKMTWQAFQQRYIALANKPEITSKLKTITKSLNTGSVYLKTMCKAIYEFYGIITGGGSGRVAVTDTYLYLNERAWWSLERNLLQHEKERAQKVESDFQDDESVVTELTNGTQEDMDTKEDIESIERERLQVEQARRKKNISPQRWRWLALVTLLTWWIPDFLIRNVGGMKNVDIIQAWREKVALNLIVGFMSGIMLFLIVGYGNLLCPPQKVFSVPDMEVKLGQNQYLMSVQGHVYDVSNFPHGNRRDYLQTYAAQDVSKFFPITTGCADYSAYKSSLVKRGTIPSAPEPPPPSATPSPSVPAATDPNKCPTNAAACHVGSNDPIAVLSKLYDNQYPQIKYAGEFVLSWNEISLHNKPSTEWVVINSRVYDVASPIGNFFHADLAQKLSTAAGRDTPIALEPYELQCLEDRYFIGVLDGRQNLQCQAAAYSLLAMTVVLCTVMAIKFLAALQLGASRIPEDIERHCIIQIPCYTENEDSLKKTIDSIAITDYSDMHKLLFIIADGFVKGSGNTQMTPELVLQILGVDNPADKLMNDDFAQRFEYIALGDGSNRLNMAKVFTGFYETLTHRVPYIVVAKCGKTSETRKPGNRGKRDSQLIMMKFLNKVHHGRPMQPLEVEMYRQMTFNLGLDPKLYEYCLMVDADTEVLKDSLVRLIAVMLHDQMVMGVCGETRIENEMDSWVTMIQVYEYYISHHLAKAFESLFGSVTCLPGCFCMYRIRSPGKKSTTLLIDDQIIQDYSDNQVDTLHKKNLLSLGEDRFLTTLMLKYFPSFRNKFSSDAACQTIAPVDYWVLLSQRRRWINSTVHNLWELVLIPQLCGCLCFSMRLVVFLDLMATLCMPASILYLCYLCFLTAQSGKVDTIAQSLYLFAAVYGMQMVVFLIKRKWEMVGWMIIYILSLPVYGFILPIYAFWHFDDFSWGNTRTVAGESASRQGHGSSEGEQQFDEKKVKLVPFDQVVQAQTQKSVPLQYPPPQFYVPPYAYPAPLPQSAKLSAGTPGSANIAPVGQRYYPFTGEKLTIQTGVQKKIERQDGFLVSVLPIPSELHRILAKFLFDQVEVMLKTEDLKSLTKKNVRDRMQVLIDNEVAHVKQGLGSSSQLLEAAIQDSQISGVDLNASPVKEWLNKVVSELLVDLTRQ